jgi:hypothetical protein
VARDRRRRGGDRKKIVDRLDWEREVAEIDESVGRGESKGQQARDRFSAEDLAKKNNPPECDYGTMYMLRAYVRLDTCRPGGMEVMSIPVSAIWAWCDRKLHAASDEVVDHFERVMCAVDRIIISRSRKKGTE